ncbi:EpsG family protein [Clostridium tagluense]|uniref:EpsG family protein n=1 Tax=Clostridium tagluense TaxID=360422 RepID=UPI001C0D92CA|nr:EpsG family protein [Clostridium tagluense]MBU3127160.1 EpsG family protein [Clostridium tagluense]
MQNIVLILVIILPVILASIRYGIGTDYFNYCYLYDINKNRSIMEIVLNDGEKLFAIIYVISNALFKDVWGVFFISSFITMFLVIKTLDYYRDKISISIGLLIYFCLLYAVSYNAVRQVMAVSIIFYAYRYIFQEKPLKYCLLVILAAQIHITAYVCLPLYFLKYTKTYKSSFKNILFYMVILFSPFLIFITLKIVKMFSISRFSSIDFDFSHIGIGFVVFILPIVIPVLLYRKPLLKLNPKYELFINILLLEFPFQYLAYFWTYGYRMIYYASIIEVILVPLIISCVPKKNNRIMLIIYFVVWYIFKFIFEFYIRGGTQIFPYRSIW